MLTCSVKRRLRFGSAPERDDGSEFVFVWYYIRRAVAVLPRAGFPRLLNGDLIRTTERSCDAEEVAGVPFFYLVWKICG